MQHQLSLMVQGRNTNNKNDTEGTNMALMAYDKLKWLANTNAVVVFSMSGCCMCHVVKSLLFGLGVGVGLTIIDLNKYESGLEIQSVLIRLSPGVQRGQSAFPVVFVGGKFLGGIETVMACHINGTLIPLLKDAGALWL